MDPSFDLLKMATKKALLSKGLRWMGLSEVEVNGAAGRCKVVAGCYHVGVILRQSLHIGVEVIELGVEVSQH